MKVLHISAYALRGGCEKNCYHFINEAKEHQHAVIVLGTEGPMSADWKNLGVDVVHLNSLVQGLSGFSKTLSSAITTNYDLAICWSTIRLPVQLNALKRASKVKVYLGNPLGANYITLKDQLLSLVYRPAKDVELMACSKYTLDTYTSNSYWNRFPYRVSLNPVALPPDRRAQLPMGDQKKIGMVARLDIIKDHKTVIRGFKILSEQFPSLELHLVGDGALREELTKLVDDLKITGKVKFHGDVKNVYDHLRSWDVFVYATTPSEGLGSAVAEAMAVGLPCVLSDLPMLRELAPTNNTVLWFPMGNEKEMAAQVTKVLNDSSLALSLAHAAYTHASEAFSPRRFVNDYIS